ncbi:integrase core domain-containing protein [Pseudomonas atacamensis]|uniref:integrase core domain-containing protein n=1 Tax=Pseudomonas atacamensis TaxID=2565368 RepID=UPI00215E60D4|nr:integrase core domain-containing protein [Pseudomonas atacamensis]UVL15448.1 integrase core domain-containing protein [Pseudomonas atacamensis]
MEGRIHGSARTTPRIRAELQASKESNRKLAARYRLNVKTVIKWRSQTTTQDARMGPAKLCGAKLTASEDAMVVEFRQRTMRPLDDMQGHLLDYFPQLSRSALHRCLVRHGINQVPKSGTATKRGKFDETEMGYLHIDSSELRLESGKQHLFVAADRVTKFTHIAFFDSATKRNGAEFLRQVVQAFPCKIHTILTENGVAFTEQPRYGNGATNRFAGHIFDRVCHEHGIKHRPTKAYHPWANGQVERMNRTIKEATIKAFHDPDFAALQAHVLSFVMAYNFARHLNTLRWRTSFKVICEAWTKNPEHFTINPHHLIPGPYTF